MFTFTEWVCVLWICFNYRIIKIRHGVSNYWFESCSFGLFGNQLKPFSILYTPLTNYMRMNLARMHSKYSLRSTIIRFTILYSRYKPYLYWQSLTFLRLRGRLSHKRRMKFWSPQDLVQKVLTQASVCPKWIKTNCKISWWPTIRWKVELVVLNWGRGLIHRK